MPRVIPESFWRKSFLMTDERYDGKKFEDLSLQLLKKLYGAGWQPTKSSHDGSRDFEKRDTRGLLWAECKAYSTRLSVYVISPTLVMALIEAPHTVIVLSRSDLNANAVRHLAAYQMVSGKTIVALDGGVLDHAILVSGLYRRYFPGLPDVRPIEPEIQVRYSLTRDALTEPSETDFILPADTTRSARPVETVRYGLLRLDFSLKNLSAATSGKVRLKLVGETLDSSLRIISFGGRKQAESCEIQVPVASIVRTSLIVQACEARAHLELPTILAIRKGAPDKQIKTGSAHVSHLYQIPVVGRTHRHALDRAGRFLRNRRRGVIITIEGASGTGKSRLMQEISRVALEEGYRCHVYNPEFEDATGAEHVIRSLIADLSELPLMVDQSGEERADAFPVGSQPGSLLTRILYDPTFPILDHIDDIVECVVSLLSKSRTLLVIDNVQFTNDRFIVLLDSLLHRLDHLRDKRVALALAVNTDFVRPESRAAALLTKLRAWSADSSRSHAVFHAQLKDFDVADVAEFVQTVFSGEDRGGGNARLYERTLHLLVKHVQPRPLNLWQSLMYLADEGALSLEGDRLRVSGDESLLSRLNYIPANLGDLLSLRWTRIRQNEARCGTDESELEATTRAAYLLGSDDRKHLLALGASERAISCLLRAGILSSRAGGQVQFFHSQVFTFFRERYVALPKETSADLKASFETLRLTKAKFQQYFILSHFADEVSKAAVVATVRHMAQSGLTVDYWRQYTNILLGYLASSGRTLSATALTGVALVGEWQQKLESLPRGAATLQEFLAKQVLTTSRRALPGPSLFHFYTVTVNACLAVYSDGEALEVIDVALHDLERSRFSSEDQRHEALAIILNRKAATLKNFGRLEEALEAGQEALQKFKEVGNKSMVVETLFDLASILLRIPERSREGWKLLEKGCRLFSVHRESMREPAPCRYFMVSAQLSIHDRRFVDAYQFCLDGARHAERVGNHFWGIRLLLLEVAARLLAGPHSAEDFATINRLLIRARDWANTSQAERSRWALDYLDGKFLTRAGDHARAAKAFSATLATLAKRLRTPEQLASRGSVLRDIAATCRRHKLALDGDSISLLTSYAMRAEIEGILALSDEAFARIEESRISESLFSHGGEIVELP
jgi:tetratricopeptide (TPR) repeat protein